MSRKVAILTSFAEFVSGYSLTGIVADQERMFREAGDQVDIFACTHFSTKNHPAPAGANILPIVPFAHLKDYHSRTQFPLQEKHPEVVEATAKMLLEELPKYDIALTHDWIFTGWNYPYTLGVQKFSRTYPEFPFLHWVHSVPSGQKDYWKIKEYSAAHRIVFPTASNRTRVAEQFNGWRDDVRIIPHIKDPRTYFGFCQDTCDFLTKYPHILQADVMQLLPASVERLDAKRLVETMNIFAAIKRMGYSVTLIVANQWCTVTQHRQSVVGYKETARKLGLIDGVDLIFTSDFGKKYEVGIPHPMIRDLFLLTNLFIFGSKEESFGLVVPEAALAGNYLVLNANLLNQREITRDKALYVEFGSHEIDFKVPSERYWEDVAKIIVARMNENESIQTRTVCRQMYNWNEIYKKFYASYMEELIQAKR